MPVHSYRGHSYAQLAGLLLLVILTFFTNLGALDPTLMEARNFITAREIVQHGNWLIPTMNGELRLAKPPLPTWATALAGLGAGDIQNLAALRFPAAVMAGFTVLFLFLLARLLTRDRLIPFLAAAVLATSYLFVHLGRQATWDVYCHSFMLGAIWLWVLACQKEGPQYALFAVCGVLLGLSFMSKGPVSFYALLLPFLLSYGYGYGRSVLKGKSRGMLLALAVCVALAALWPLYVYLKVPGTLAQNVSQESGAWLARHVQKFWFYWSFPGEAGVWVLFAFVALLPPYARPRVGGYGNYRFLAAWVLVAVVLLSLVPEKKERYLLPLLIPMALLTAHYLKYLIDAFAAGRASRWDTRLLQLNGLVISLAALAVPFLLYFFGYKAHALPGAAQVAASLLFFGAGGCMLWMIRKKAVYPFILLTCATHVLLLLLVIPLYTALTLSDAELSGLQEVRQRKELQPLPFYAVGGLKPEFVWEVGKEVDTARVVKNQLQLPEQLPAVIFSADPLPPVAGPGNHFSFRKIRLHHLPPKPADATYEVYIVSEKPPH